MTDVKEKLVELLAGAGMGKTERYFLADCLIAHGVTVQEWISVKDRLPETTIRCIVSKYNVPFLAYWDGEKWRETNKLIVVDGVTHWMPMPIPPKGE